MNKPNDDDVEVERVLTQLFAHAKPRMQPPPADAEEIRRAVYAEWEAVTGRRVFAQRVGYAAAASMLLAVGLWVGGTFEPAAPPPSLARVERLQGAIDGIALGGGLAEGHVVRTGSAQLALRLASGGSLRIGAQSEIELTGPDAAELVAGVVYFDSEDERSGREFMITTALGSVRDVGTQFVVKLDDAVGELNVGVRDGRVVLTRDGESGAASVGERLVTTQGASGIRRDVIATFGAEWEWAERIAPPFDTDGRTVGEFLVWFAAQTGRSVVFATPDAEQAARAATVNGTIDFEPLQTRLSAVLAIADLTFSLEGDRVVIARR